MKKKKGSFFAALRSLFRGAYAHSAGSWGHFVITDQDLI